MPEEIDVTNIIGEQSPDESVDMTSFDDTTQESTMCTITVGGTEIEVERCFTYRNEGNELDEDSFTREEMIEFAREHEYAYIEGVWQSCDPNIVWDCWNDNYIEEGDSVFGWISRREEGYFHYQECYIRYEDTIYIDDDVASEHDVHHNECCDEYRHIDDPCSCNDEDDCYFDNKRSYDKHQSLSYHKKFGTNSPTFSISNGMRYTFGVEIETSRGSIGHYDDLNLASVYDGSTSGPEYVTGILKGDYGFNHLKTICDKVHANHEINKRCGVHVHIGGQFNRLFTIMLLRLGYQIQDEIYRMMPPSRLGNTFCKYIPDYVMDINLTNWRKHLGKYIHGSGNTLDENCNKKSNLGSYPSTRYRWINCVNFSSNSGKPTVEFRNHSASMSYYKIRNWTLMCMAIVRFAQNNQKRIWYNLEDITLHEVMMTSLGNNIGLQIMSYYQKRVALFAHNYTENGDYYNKLPSGYRRTEETID